MEAFRRAAKRTHPDVAGGSKSAFQQCQEAISVLSQELPTQDDLIKARAAHIDVMEEQRFSKRRGMGSLIAAPRGIFQKLKLNLKADLSDRIASSRDYVFEKAKSSDRPVEATGRNVMTPEQIQLEQEMDELKREDLRTKGVGRMVDSLIAEAIREGKFSSPSGKGQPLNVGRSRVLSKRFSFFCAGGLLRSSPLFGKSVGTESDGKAQRGWFCSRVGGDSKRFGRSNLFATKAGSQGD